MQRNVRELGLISALDKKAVIEDADVESILSSILLYLFIFVFPVWVTGETVYTPFGCVNEGLTSVYYYSTPRHSTLFSSFLYYYDINKILIK